MGYEHVREPQDLARRQWREVAEIEQQRASFEQEINVHRRVAKRIVDRMWMEERCHAGPTCYRGNPS